jgi:hypothetical protein
MFPLFAPRKLQNFAAAIVATVFVMGAAISPFTVQAQPVSTDAATR